MQNRPRSHHTALHSDAAAECTPLRRRRHPVFAPPPSSRTSSSRGHRCPSGGEPRGAPACQALATGADLSCDRRGVARCDLRDRVLISALSYLPPELPAPRAQPSMSRCSTTTRPRPGSGGGVAGISDTTPPGVREACGAAERVAHRLDVWRLHASGGLGDECALHMDVPATHCTSGLLMSARLVTFPMGRADPRATSDTRAASGAYVHPDGYGYAASAKPSSSGQEIVTCSGCLS